MPFFPKTSCPEVITTGSLEFEFAKGKGIKGVRHPEAKMVRTDRWKLVRYAGGEGELYDMRDDPDEQRNLFEDPQHREVVHDLERRLLDWLMRADEADQIAPRWEEI